MLIFTNMGYFYIILTCEKINWKYTKEDSSPRLNVLPYTVSRTNCKNSRANY